MCILNQNILDVEHFQIKIVLGFSKVIYLIKLFLLFKNIFLKIVDEKTLYIKIIMKKKEMLSTKKETSPTLHSARINEDTAIPFQCLHCSMPYNISVLQQLEEP